MGTQEFSGRGVLRYKDSNSKFSRPQLSLLKGLVTETAQSSRENIISVLKREIEFLIKPLAFGLRSCLNFGNTVKKA
jgi:hypothetical protein